jgi:hypothetical protein
MKTLAQEHHNIVGPAPAIEVSISVDGIPATAVGHSAGRGQLSSYTAFPNFKTTYIIRHKWDLKFTTSTRANCCAIIFV